MSTPVKPSGSSVPAVPATPAPRPEPVPVLAPLGWVLILAAAIALLLASWAVYPNDYEGMWAGYRGSLIGTIVLIAALALNSSLPKRPALAAIGLSGIALVLFGIFLDNSTEVVITEISTGALLLVGTALYATGRHD